MGIDSLPNYNSFVEALNRTLGPKNAGLMIAYLESQGAIQNNELDGIKVEEVLRSLFGESALAVYRLLMKLSNSESTDKFPSGA